MKVAILEDELLTGHFLKETIEKLECQTVGIARDLEAGRQLLSQHIDLFLLDIHLGGNDASNEDGLVFARELDRLGIPFIFITANVEEETTLKAAKTQPFGYLTKPFNSRDILASISIFKARNSRIQAGLSISGSFGKRLILLNEIYYLEASGAYVIIHGKSGKFTQRITLKKILEKVDSPGFVRIHRSYAVNEDFVTELATTQLVCAGVLLPISDSYKEDLLRLSGKWMK